MVDEGRPDGSPDVVDLRDRLEAVGGALEVQRTPGRGTAVIGWVPAEPVPVAAEVGVVSV